MYAKTFTVATLAAVASAQLPALVRREFLLEARETQSMDPTCQSAIASVLPIYSEIPIPPSDLESITLPSNPCETPSLTGSLASEYSSYTSEVLAWYSSNSAELLSALASCSQLAAYATAVPVCSSLASEVLSSASAITVTSAYTSPVTTAEATTTKSAQTTANSAATAATKSAASSASVVVTAGGTRETGFVAGIVGVIGFVAAVAAL